jgi:hypothetical protein
VPYCPLTVVFAVADEEHGQNDDGWINGKEEVGKLHYTLAALAPLVGGCGRILDCLSFWFLFPLILISGSLLSLPLCAQ